MDRATKAANENEQVEPDSLIEVLRLEIVYVLEILN
jgi:hypothetical protein